MAVVVAVGSHPGSKPLLNEAVRALNPSLRLRVPRPTLDHILLLLLLS
jgi:hypothetical protein